MSRQQVKKSGQVRRSDEDAIGTAGADRPAQKRVDAEEVKAEMDDILDEIDGVLEENAEEFVKGFIQKGGE